MATKLAAAKKAGKSGVATLIVNGKVPGILNRAMAGEAVGTLFLAARESLPSRKHWIAYTLRPERTAHRRRRCAQRPVTAWQEPPPLRHRPGGRGFRPGRLREGLRRRTGRNSPGGSSTTPTRRLPASWATGAVKSRRSSATGMVMKSSTGTTWSSFEGAPLSTQSRRCSVGTALVRRGAATPPRALLMSALTLRTSIDCESLE